MEVREKAGTSERHITKMCKKRVKCVFREKSNKSPKVIKISDFKLCVHFCRTFLDVSNPVEITHNDQAIIINGKLLKSGSKTTM